MNPRPISEQSPYERVMWMERLLGAWAHINYMPRADVVRVVPRDGVRLAT